MQIIPWKPDWRVSSKTTWRWAALSMRTRGWVDSFKKDCPGKHTPSSHQTCQIHSYLRWMTPRSTPQSLPSLVERHKMTRWISPSLWLSLFRDIHKNMDSCIHWWVSNQSSDWWRGRCTCSLPRGDSNYSKCCHWNLWKALLQLW